MSDKAIARFEDTLTWSEANDLRIIISDHRRALRAQLLLAREEGSSSRAARLAQYDDAVRLESKVLAMFNRLSGAR